MHAYGEPTFLTHTESTVSFSYRNVRQRGRNRPRNLPDPVHGTLLRPALGANMLT